MTAGDQESSMDPTALRKEMEKLATSFNATEETMHMGMTNLAKMYKMRVDTLIEADFTREEAVAIVARRGLE